MSRRFTKAEDKWLKENYNNFENSKIPCELEKACGRLFTAEGIRKHCNHLGIKKEKFYNNVYSDEEEKWIIDNYDVYKNQRDLTRIYNQTFHKNKAISSINHKCVTLGLLKDINYTEEQKKWLIDNYDNYLMVTDLARAFNEHFNCKRNIYSICRYCSKRIRKKEFQYSQQEIEWLKANFEKYPTMREITNEFNKVFPTRSVSGLRDYCNLKLGLKKIGKDYPIGHTKIDQRGTVWVKVRRGSFRNNYERLNKLTWEKANGKIPEGFRLVHLDGNYQNCALENLALVDHHTQVKIRHFTVKGETDFNKKVVENCKIESQIERLMK